VSGRARTIRSDRRYALLALYQFDSGLAGDLDAVRAALESVDELGDDGEGADLSTAAARLEARDPERIIERRAAVEAFGEHGIERAHAPEHACRQQAREGPVARLEPMQFGQIRSRIVERAQLEDDAVQHLARKGAGCERQGVFGVRHSGDRSDRSRA
jgi:hypothetical protein